MNFPLLKPLPDANPASAFELHQAFFGARTAGFRARIDAALSAAPDRADAWESVYRDLFDNPSDIVSGMGAWYAQGGPPAPTPDRLTEIVRDSIFDRIFDALAVPSNPSLYPDRAWDAEAARWAAYFADRPWGVQYAKAMLARRAELAGIEETFYTSFPMYRRPAPRPDAPIE